MLILNPVGLAGSYLVAYSFALAGVVWLVVTAVMAFERREHLHFMTGSLQHN